MIIRNMRQVDEVAVYDMICLLEDQVLSIDAFHEIFLHYLTSESMFCFVATDDEQIIGFLSVCIHHHLHHVAKIVEIQEIFVYEAYRNQCIGKKLFNKAKEVAMQRNVLQIEVCSNERRLDAHRFYLHQGMEKKHFKFTMKL